MSNVVLSSVIRVIATLAAFSLGVYGFREAYAAEGGGGGLADYAYKSLQLVVGQFPTELIAAELPLSLTIARWALPLITFWATVSLAWQQVRNPVRLAMIRWRGEHLVVFGDDAVAARVVGKERAAKRPVVLWIADDRQHWVHDAANAGAPHVKTDKPNRGADRLGLDKARSVLIAGPDDATNVALAGEVISAAIEQRRAGDPLTLVARVDDLDLRGPIERRFEASADHQIVRVRLASLPDIAARQLFLKMPLDRFQRGEERRLCVFLVGFSPSIERYVLRLLAAAHMSGGVRPLIVVLETGAEKTREVFFARRPGARALTPVHFVEASVEHPALIGDAMDAAIKQHGDPTAIVIDPRDETRALPLAMAIEDRLRQLGQISPPLHVRLPKGSADSDLPCEVMPFGDLDTLADPEHLLQEQLDQLARSAHEYYLEGRLDEGDQIGSRISMHEWNDLPESVRDDNRLLTDCYELKLRDVGARIIAGEAGTFRFEPAELEELARAEHDRWMSAKVIDGWAFGATRDDNARLHPDIVPYDDLSEDRKDLDREQVRVLTHLVSATGRHAARDLVIALGEADDTAQLVTETLLDDVAANYPDRAIVVLGRFESPAHRAAMNAARHGGAAFQLIVGVDPDRTLAKVTRADRSAARRLYRAADRIFALPQAEWSTNRRQGFLATRADIWLSQSDAPAGPVPVIKVDGRGGVVSAPWTR